MQTKKFHISNHLKKIKEQNSLGSKLAVLNHAVKIFSEKKGKTIELRMTQIISLILFIRAENRRRILQISTG